MASGSSGGKGGKKLASTSASKRGEKLRKMTDTERKQHSGELAPF